MLDAADKTCGTGTCWTPEVSDLHAGCRMRAKKGVPFDKKSILWLVADLPNLLGVSRPPVRMSAQQWNTDGLVMYRIE